jgi:hypothetical protein
VNVDAPIVTFLPDETVCAVALAIKVVLAALWKHLPYQTAVVKTGMLVHARVISKAKVTIADALATAVTLVVAQSEPAPVVIEVDEVCVILVCVSTSMLPQPATALMAVAAEDVVAILHPTFVDTPSVILKFDVVTIQINPISVRVAVVTDVVAEVSVPTWYVRERSYTTPVPGVVDVSFHMVAASVVIVVVVDMAVATSNIKMMIDFI